MNVGSFQALIGSAGSSATSVGQAVNGTGGGGFGSVLNSLVASNAVIPSSDVLTKSEIVLDEAISKILSATTVEEVVAVLRTVGTDIHLHSEKLPEMEQLIGALDMNVEKLIEQMIPLLEKAGLSESELEAAKYTNNIWSLLDTVDNVAPKFFAELTTALEGKGAIPKEEAVQLVALLKSLAIEAPKMDLVEKQEQQVFALQGFLAVVSEKIETIQPANQNQQTVAQMLETQQAIRIIPQAQMSQHQTNEESLKESPKETIQQPVVAPTQQTSMREEIRLAQPESSNNARNEALIREMQAIFKRSNFGQTGGTNRLLVKLYPEHLGQVRIELLQTNGIMTARILASSALGKEMLDSQLHQLRAAFAQQNLQVERIDISQTLQDTSRNDRDNAFNQHFKKEQEQTEQQNEQSSDENMTFEEYMIELEA